MPSNAELQAQLKELAPDLDTGEMNNAALSAKLKELKAQSDKTKGKDDAPPETQSDKTKGKGNRVADGKSLVTRRGIRGPGDEVSADEVAGGQKTIDALKSKGVLK